jgi:hypothetical protein
MKTAPPPALRPPFACFDRFDAAPDPDSSIPYESLRNLQRSVEVLFYTSGMFVLLCPSIDFSPLT